MKRFGLALSLGLATLTAARAELNPWVGATAAVISPVGLAVAGSALTSDDPPSGLWLYPLITPSYGIGQFLQSRNDRGVTFFIIDGVLTIVVVVSAVAMIDDIFDDLFSPENEDRNRFAEAAFVASSIGLLGVKVWEAGDAIYYAAAGDGGGGGSSGEIALRPAKPHFALSVGPTTRGGFGLRFAGAY